MNSIQEEQIIGSSTGELAEILMGLAQVTSNLLRRVVQITTTAPALAEIEDSRYLNEKFRTAVEGLTAAGIELGSASAYLLGYSSTVKPTIAKDVELLNTEASGIVQ